MTDILAQLVEESKNDDRAEVFQERFAKIHDAFVDGKAVRIHTANTSDSYAYYDAENDDLYLSFQPKAESRVLHAYGDLYEESGTILQLVFVDDVEAVELEDTPIHHSVYGLKPVMNR
ncbi:hypothetical protein [Halocalculus aciditolerans]|uniref:Uncharacterized protein n=1 Tax=Halocalculus aciditolerans TaxID=1383812 RepID=A0A830FGY8_9EURY|nr:hypothetical protein [Halocalculus aciditolerans]GGL73507.1 hypothetical protein GCM10009039_34510 [Halocalculus aciditolerans]